MTQLTYEAEAVRAYAGMPADPSNWPFPSITRASEETDPVPFGKPAVAGTNAETQFLLPSSAGDKFLGVTTHTHRRLDLDADGVVEGEPTTIFRRGRIWVVCTTGCAYGDLVYWRHTTTPGTWQNVATEAVVVPGAQWVTVAAADELAVIDINFP